jgi:AcrR family transcriptional regulator
VTAIARAPHREEHPTRELLVEVATRLIAERGIGNVSVRDITSAAGVNTAAINYHFGSKDGLVDAVVVRHAEHFGLRRRELLLEVPSGERTLRDVVRALVVSTAELAADTEHGGRVFLQAKLRLHADPSTLRRLERYFQPYTDEFLDALAEVTPDLPEPVRTLRYAIARETIDVAYATDNYAQWVKRRAGRAPSHEAFTTQVIDFIVAGLAAPA